MPSRRPATPTSSGTASTAHGLASGQNGSSPTSSAADPPPRPSRALNLAGDALGRRRRPAPRRSAARSILCFVDLLHFPLSQIRAKAQLASIRSGSTSRAQDPQPPRLLPLFCSSKGEKRACKPLQHQLVQTRVDLSVRPREAQLQAGLPLARLGRNRAPGRFGAKVNRGLLSGPAPFSLRQRPRRPTVSSAPSTSSFGPFHIFFLPGEFSYFSREHSFAEKPSYIMHIISHKPCIGIKQT